MYQTGCCNSWTLGGTTWLMIPWPWLCWAYALHFGRPTLNSIIGVAQPYGSSSVGGGFYNRSNRNVTSQEYSSLDIYTQSSDEKLDSSRCIYILLILLWMSASQICSGNWIRVSIPPRVYGGYFWLQKKCKGSQAILNMSPHVYTAVE